MMSVNKKNESVQKSIDEETSSSSSPQLKHLVTSNEKATQKKTRKNRKKSSPKSYEHHLEKWLENTSNFSLDENNLKEGRPFNASNAALKQQRSTNRRKDQTQQSFAAVNDAILFNKSFEGSQANFKSFPWQQRSDSPTTNEQLSLSTQQDFVSLSMLKNGKSESEDQEKNNESTSTKFSELMINEMRKNHKKSTKKNQHDSNSTSTEGSDEIGDDEVEDSKKMENDSNDFVDLNNKTILVALLKQINRLHETNTKIFRNLHDTKVELEALKHTPNNSLRHRRESFNSQTPSVHSQQFIPSAPSPAPSYHSISSSHYPGVVTDMIREVRESMKMREDSMMNRVKTMIDEKSWTSNDLNMRLLGEFEKIKVQLHNMKLEQLTTNDRMMKVEEEVRSMKSAFLRGNTNSFQQQYSQYPSPSNIEQMKRSSIMSLDNNFDDNFYNMKRYYPQSPPKRHENDDEEFDRSNLVQMEKDTLKLRRDLQDAIACKAQAEQKILALEHLVTTLKTSHPSNSNSSSIHNNHDDQNSMLDRSHRQMPVPHGGSNNNNSSTTTLKQGAIQLRITSQSNNENSQNLTTGKIITPKAVKASQVTVSSSTSLPVTDL